MTGAAPRKSFGSDNHAGTHPAVMRAIVEANAGDAIPYGGDPWTEQAAGEIRRLAGAQGEVFFVFNGSGANVLGLDILLGRHEAVICAESAHQHGRVRCRGARPRDQAPHRARAGRKAHP